MVWRNWEIPGSRIALLELQDGENETDKLYIVFLNLFETNVEWITVWNWLIIKASMKDYTIVGFDVS